MPSRTNSWVGVGLGLLTLLVAPAGRAGEVIPPSTAPRSVGIVRTAAWSEGDAAREGAAELVILLEIARLRHESGGSGLVAVGDRRGLFSAGAENALQQAVLHGIPVVKLARSGRVLPAPHGLFLDGGNLPEEEAQRVLARCLALYGALPADGGRADLPALRSRLELFQKEFAVAVGTRVALR